MARGQITAICRVSCPVASSQERVESGPVTSASISAATQKVVESGPESELNKADGIIYADRGKYAL